MISSLLNFSGRSRLPAVLQTEAAEYGLACLAMISSFYDHRIDLIEPACMLLNVAGSWQRPTAPSAARSIQDCPSRLYNTLRRRYPVSLKGVSLRGSIHIASLMHLGCRPLRFELHDIRLLSLPAIVHWDLNHFVVLKAAITKGVVIHDPAAGIVRYPLAVRTA